jgi:hypothetical protein
MPTFQPPLVKVRAYRAEEIMMDETVLGFTPDVRNVLLVSDDTCIVLQMPGRWEWLYLQVGEGASTHELGCHCIDSTRGYCYLWLHRSKRGERLWLLVDQPLPVEEAARIAERMRWRAADTMEVAVGLDRLRLEEIGSQPICIER